MPAGVDAAKAAARPLILSGRPQYRFLHRGPGVAGVCRSSPRLGGPYGMVANVRRLLAAGDAVCFAYSGIREGRLGRAKKI